MEQSGLVGRQVAERLLTVAWGPQSLDRRHPYILFVLSDDVVVCWTVSGSGS